MKRWLALLLSGALNPQPLTDLLNQSFLLGLAASVLVDLFVAPVGAAAGAVALDVGETRNFRSSR